MRAISARAWAMPLCGLWWGKDCAAVLCRLREQVRQCTAVCGEQVELRHDGVIVEGHMTNISLKYK
jgi:hypothetical protein